MKIFLSTDMEGTAGVVDWDQCRGPGAEYDYYCGLLQAEVNAAIEGAIEAGAAEFLVNDSHGLMRNLRPDAQQEGRGSLRVEVPQQRAADVAGGEVGQADGGGGLSDATLDVAGCDDLHRGRLPRELAMPIAVPISARHRWPGAGGGDDRPHGPQVRVPRAGAAPRRDGETSWNRTS